MARTTPLTIVLERVGDEDIHEGPGSGSIYPGYICQFESGGSGTLEACSTAGIKNVVVAVENPYDDDNSKAAINSPYTSGQTVRYIFPRPGDLLYLYGTGVAAKEKYTAYKASTATDGYVEETAGSAAEIFGYAWDTVDTSGATSGTRVKVRVV